MKLVNRRSLVLGACFVYVAQLSIVLWGHCNPSVSHVHGGKGYECFKTISAVDFVPLLGFVRVWQHEPVTVVVTDLRTGSEEEISLDLCRDMYYKFPFLERYR